MGTTDITLSEKSSITGSWKNCLPGEISNLFYHLVHHSNGESTLQRYTTFNLSEEGINLLVDPPAEIDTIRIYMGCAPITSGTRQGQPTFTPLLGILFKDPGIEEMVFSLPPAENESLVQISSAISDLFRQKWLEISNDQIADAFSGYTVANTKVSALSSPPIKLRVNHYTFDNKDVLGIQSKLRAIHSDSPFLKLHMGAGLTVEMVHPFNFRPILEVGEFIPEQDGDGDEENYERSQPCPPYCPGGEG